MASRFADFVQDPPIEVFELTRQFNEDTHPSKVNLGVGGYNFDCLELFKHLN
jgi:aspartate/tyrosine/aromatic aminotransferase